MSVRTPSYRLHKPTQQAVVSIDGRDFYLGRYGSAASRAEYDRLIAEWLAHGRRLPAANEATGDTTITELVVEYVRQADSYYVKDGKPTSEARMIRDALKVLRRLYGATPAKDFGPLKLKTVRQAFIDRGLCRREVNRFTGLVVRFFKWAVENERVPPSIHHGLKAVAGLRKGRSEVRESVPVKPVPEAFVEAVKPFVSRQVWAMIQLQRVTGMRPGEAVQMRTCDLDTTGTVWTYVPESHKTSHHGKARTIYLGPKAQAILEPWLRTELAAYLFSPAEALTEHRAELRRERKTPVQPSQKDRRKKGQLKKKPGARYTTESYGRAIAEACVKADVPHWHPHQLRHNAATWLRKQYGLEVARVILGHSSAIITEIYAEVDRDKAIEVMGKIG